MSKQTDIRSKVEASDEEIKFFSTVKYSDSCWLWMGYKNKKNYGVFHYKYKMITAHRWSFEFFKHKLGKRHCCHHCDNPSCVNPDHLFSGSPGDNVIDSVEKRRHRNNKKTHCPYGHAYSGKNLKISVKGWRYCRICVNAIKLRSYHKKKLALAAFQAEVEKAGKS